MQESQNSEPSHVVNGLDIDPSSLPSWISEFEERKQRILGEAVEAQNRLDPNGRFDALSRGQKTRLTKALFRFFLFQQGRFPSLPIPREDVMRVFETVRSEANLASTPKLFPYFLTEVRKEMAEWGLDIREMEKKVPSSMARNRKTVQWSYVFYLQSFLPEEFRMTFMEKREKQLIGILGVLVRLTVAGEGKLRRSDAIQLLKNLELHEGVYDPTFGEWEKTIFEEALKRRFLISSRLDPDLFELGEAAFLEMTESIPLTFMHFCS